MLEKLGLQISDCIVIVLAVAYMTERFIYRHNDKKKQAYRNTIGDFEKLLSGFNEIRSSVSYESTTTEHLRDQDAQGNFLHREQKITYVKTGLNAFVDTANIVSKDKGTQNWITSGGRDPNYIEDDGPYEFYVNFLQYYFNHYFTFLNDLLEQITTNETLTNHDQALYIDRIRAALSPPELIVLYYYCMLRTDIGRALKEYIIRHNLFRSIPYSFLVDRPDNQLTFYEM